MSEHDEQCALIRWFNLQYPKLKGMLFSIPNGAHLSGSAKVRAIKMNKMKNEGLRPGASDLFLAVPTKAHHGFFIEMKDKGKKERDVTEKQKAFLDDTEKLGYKSGFYFGFEEAKEAISEYLNESD